jgi:lipoprotein NlpI
MKIPRKLALYFSPAFSLLLLSSVLSAQEELLESCFINAQAVNQGEEIFWTDLEPCNALVVQLDRLDLSDRQEIALRLNRAILLTELTEFARAKADLEAGFLIDPQSLYLHMNMGVLSMVEQDYAAAIESFSLVLEIEPITPLALFNRALAYNYSEDLVSSVNDLLSLQFEHPSESLAWVTEESLPTLWPLLPELIIPDENFQEEGALPDQLGELNEETIEVQRIEPIPGG